MEKRLPSEEKIYMNYYNEEAKNVEIPNMSEYDFLYERNRKYMSNTALTFAGKKITYEEMHTKIDEYARALYKKGVRQGDIVALGLANTPEIIYISYALLKLGAVISPINLTYNQYKMARDIDIIKPKMFIGINDTYKNFKSASKGHNIEILTIPAVNSIDDKKLHALYNLKQLLTGNLSLNPNESLNHILKTGKLYKDVVYGKYQEGQLDEIMFTGGSSGIHKGVALNGNGLNAVVKALDYVLPLEPGEKFLGNLPQFMAFGKMSFHYALCKNLNLELTLKMLPKDFIEELLRTNAQGAMGGPVHWETLINANLKKDALKNIKAPITGGEQLKFEKEKNK